MKTNLKNAIAVFSGNFGIFSLPILTLSLFTWMNEASSNVRDLSPLISGLNDMMEYAK